MERDPLERLRIWTEVEGFKGYDPYDALNSPLLSGLSLGNKYLRIAFIQTLKRLPVNLRPHLLVKKDYNPKGLGLFLWGYAKRYAREKEPQCLEQISKLLDLLDGCKTTMNVDSRFRGNDKGARGNDKAGCGNDKAACGEVGIGHGWGYNFDWQSRAFFVPKHTPTIVNSAFIGHALLDTWRITGNQQALEMALPIADFILRDLNRHEEDSALCFSYTPLDRYFVHNANLMGASLLIRLYETCNNLSALKDDPYVSFPHSTLSFPRVPLSFPRAPLSFPRSSLSFPRKRESIKPLEMLDSRLRGNDGVENDTAGTEIKAEFKKTALAALAYTMRHQRDDGSWYYAEKEGAHWVDSFHTGFNLQSVLYFLEAGLGEEYREGFQKGVQFYAEHFFLPDGTPKYYHDRTYPIDIHAPAQAVVFFSRMGPAYAKLARRILKWMTTNMQDPEGFFYFQKHPWYTNRIPYMRWGQAWAFHALTEHFLHEPD